MAQPAGTRRVTVTERASTHGGTNHDWFFTSALMLVALLPRLFVAIAWTREPVWDGHYYHFGGTRIADGLGYSEDVLINGILTWKPWCHYPVGYSAFLGGFYKVFGAGLIVAPIANAVVGTLCAGVTYRLARFALSPTRARIAGLICAVHPGLILSTGLVMTEGLSAFGMALAGAIALRWPTVRGAVLGGLVVGLSALVRPTALLALPLFLFCFWPNTGGALLQRVKKATALASLAALVSLLTVMPWTARNCKVMDGCALISTNGGWNLAIGALTKTGRFTTLSASDGCPVVTGQVQQDRCWGEVGRDRILDAPMEWLRLIPLKLRHTFNHESFAVGYLAEADPDNWPETRKKLAREALTLFHHLLMLAASLSLISWGSPSRGRSVRSFAAGWYPSQIAIVACAAAFVVYAFRQPDTPLFWLLVFAPLVWAARLPGSHPAPPAWGYLWGWVLLTAITHAVFFGDDRYHLTISPLLCILAAGVFRMAPKPRSSLA